LIVRRRVIELKSKLLGESFPLRSEAVFAVRDFPGRPPYLGRASTGLQVSPSSSVGRALDF
jgi:hypothetical protein